MTDSKSKPARRDILAATVAATVAFAFPKDSVSMTKSKPGLPRVAVIGAGFGGLACGYELSQAGYHVDLFEARNRISGRVHSISEFAPGQHVEFGAELIGANHPHWQRYAKLFAIELGSVDDEQPSPTKTIFVDGIRDQGDAAVALEHEIDQGRDDLNRQAAEVDWGEPWKSLDAERLDRMSTADWLKTLAISDRAKRLLTVELELDMAVSLQDMNFLALLSTVAAHGGEAFWTESESFRAVAGNQSLATHLAAGIRNGELHLNCPVKTVHVGANGMVVGALDGREAVYDDVVLAIPPSTWDQIELSPPLPPALRPQMGMATKFLTACTHAFWLPRQSADALTDTLIGSTWEGPVAEGSERRSLVGFAGGPIAEKLHELPVAQRELALLSGFEEVMPGYQTAHLKSEFVDWPAEPWTRCGYSFPLPGQFIAQSRILREGIGHLHFAGEHASFGFTGYMEGALESGVSLARRLIKRDQSVGVSK